MALTARLACPITVLSDNDSAASVVGAPSLQRPFTPGLSLFRLEEVWSISTSSTESGRANDSSHCSVQPPGMTWSHLQRTMPRETHAAMHTKHRRADAHRAGCGLEPIQRNQVSRSLRGALRFAGWCVVCNRVLQWSFPLC